MGYQPWYKKQTYPALQIPLNVEGNADNITGLTTAAFTAVLRNTSLAPAVDTIGSGTFAIVTANPAVISYTFSTADVASVWSGYVIIEAVFPGVAVYDPIPFAITDD